MRKYIFITIGLSLFMFACSNSRTLKSIQIPTSTIANPDTSNYAIFILDTSHSFSSWYLGSNKPRDLNSSELLKIDTILAKSIAEYNQFQEKQIKYSLAKDPKLKLEVNNYTIDLKYYKRQYVPSINTFGEKEVWVNCLCITSSYQWRTSLIHVEDGGNCYFNVILNLTTGNYNNLSVNGDA